MLRRRLAGLLSSTLLLGVTAGAVAVATPADAAPAVAKHHPVVMFSSDGMRPDLMQLFAQGGSMPTYDSLMRTGATGDNGLTQGFPPNTGQGWYTLATGAYPGVHGSTNNTFYDTRQPFTSSTSFSFHGNGSGPGTDPTSVLEAQSVASSAELAGKKVAQLEWTGGLNANINGPTVDYDTNYSKRGVLEYPQNATKQASAAKFGLAYETASFTPANGWTNVPTGSLAPQQTTLTVASTSTAVNPDRVFDLYAYSTNGTAYNRVIVVPSGAGKDGAKSVGTLVPGRYSAIKLTGADGLTGTAAGESTGFYVKIMTMAKDLSRFGLYFTSLTRPNAHCATAACAKLPTGATGEDPLAKYIADHLPPAVFGDFAPVEAGLIDEDTWYQQTVDLNQAYDHAVFDYVLKTLQPDTDVLLAGTDQTDEVSHQMLGLITPKAPDGTRNPYYDRVAGAGARDHRTAQRLGYIRGAYHSADDRLGLVRSLIGSDADILASSDHGFAPQWYAIDSALPLKQLGLQDVEQTGNCRPASTGTTIAKSCEAGGTAQIYLSVKGRSPDGVLDPSQYTATVNKIVAAYKNLKDPTTGKSIVEAVFTKAQMANVEGSDSLNPTRTGDVVVVSKVPYEFDGATTGTPVAPSLFFGQHGYLPDDVDLAHNVNMHATFVAGGPDVRHVPSVRGVRAVDLAPTLAVLGGFDPPLQAQGSVLTSVLKGGGKYRTGQVLGINDVHGNITGKGLSYTDPYTGVKDSAGGIATLATYLTQARSTEKNTVTVQAGDMVGASPPESALLRDKPTLDALNLMGIDVGTLGNHEFDRGVPELLKQVQGGTSTVDPKTTFAGANYPVVDANVISNSTGKPLLPPYAIKKVGGVRVAFIGATTITTPSIVTTGGTDGVHFVDEATAVNKYVKALQKKGVHSFVVVVHEGGTQSSYPVGTVNDRIHDIAAALDPAVKLVISGHSHTVIDTRVGHALVIQASSFTRAYDDVHLLLNAKAGTIAAAWGSVQPVWNTDPPASTDPAGATVTPDPAVQKVVDAAVKATNPVTQKVINTAAADVPSQREGGQTAAGESPAGDLIADSQQAFAKTQLAFVNTGSVRAGLLAGPVTYGDLFTMQPFQDDYVDTFSLTGTQVWALLNQQLAAGTGGIMQVAGLHFTYTGTQGSGHITGVWLGKAGDNSHPIPNDTSASFTGTANSFMVGGGDGFTVLEKASNIVQRPEAELQPLLDYVAALPTPFTYTTDGRIRQG
ncbi:alkaline phosphatase family protein [uncultured Jatrophihabitans sp.]|uniref:alkaline phosphatase family protein n=1 Tax=uncultured Jatrophihabitans sp. TaxID=1610747 RepID=UPI0035CC18C4